MKPEGTARKSKPRNKVVLAVNVVAIVVVAAALALLGAALFADPAPPPAAQRPVAPAATPAAAAPQPAGPTAQTQQVAMTTTSGPQSATAPARQGTPWEYDEATNHHFDPRAGHAHWHPGPPPPPEQRASLEAQAAQMPPALTPSITPMPPGFDPTAASPGSPTITPMPPGFDPTAAPTTPPASTAPTRTGQPWEYDAATNHHWDPGHGHWHAGPPPPEAQRTTP